MPSSARLAWNRDPNRPIPGPAIQEERPFRRDQYGTRGIVSADSIPIRFEIGREGRIALSGCDDATLAVPRVSAVDRIAETLLANADRGQDHATGSRDAVDLGMLALRRGSFPDEARDKAEHAGGADIGLKLRWVLDRLAAMERPLFDDAVNALRGEVQRMWAV